MTANPLPEPEPPALEGRIVLWEARGGLIWIDAVLAPAGSPALGAPVGIHGRLTAMPLAMAVLTTVDFWARRGDLVRFESRVGRDGTSRVRLSRGPTWLTLDAVPSAPVPALAA